MTSTPGRTPGQVLVVGSVNIDFVVRAARLPRAGETVTGGEFSRHHGGKGANQAVAAARLGARVTFTGAVGDDDNGRAAIAALSAEGVDVSGVVTLPDAATGVALIMVDAGGENQIAVASGANARLASSLVNAALAGRPATPGGAFLANLEISDDVLLAGARFAHGAGMQLIVNPAPARPLPAELLQMSPLLLPNEGEAETLTGLAHPARAALALFEQTSAPVVVTLGAAGAMLVDDGRVNLLPAPSVEVVDTTGAGDSFCGAFAALLAKGAGLDEAVRSAIVAASLSVTRPGARDGMPSSVELARAMP